MRYIKKFKLFEADHAYHRILDLNYSFKLYKVADKIWCVVAPDAVTLCSTFLRCQEYYESSNPIFQFNKFKKVDYIKWYKDDFSKSTDFHYHLDWAGFNLPSESIKKCMSSVDDTDDWDRIMQSIINTIEKTETGRWYLLGVSELDVTDPFSTLAHEMAHGMFYIDAAYNAEMKKLISEMPEDGKKAFQDEIINLGYAESSLIDETQAYLSTGITKEMKDRLDEFKYDVAKRKAFRDVFAKYIGNHMIKKPKSVKIDFI